jgi:hypothetical protein
MINSIELECVTVSLTLILAAQIIHFARLNCQFRLRTGLILAELHFNILSLLQLSFTPDKTFDLTLCCAAEYFSTRDRGEEKVFLPVNICDCNFLILASLESRANQSIKFLMLLFTSMLDCVTLSE